MKRITHRDSNGNARIPVGLDENGTVTLAFDSLAEYEDTNLTPDEIKKHETAYIEIMTRTYGPLHQKIGQWLQADQDGRLIVIPCKEGDVVYDISDGTPYATRVLGFACLVDHWACWTARSYPDLSYFGERIFLTCEEAEAALKKREVDDKE